MWAELKERYPFFADHEVKAAPRTIPVVALTRAVHNDITYDIKKALPALYAPKPGGFHVVDVPEIAFLMVDGHGDPNVSPAYADAVTALYTLSYTVRAIAKAELGRVHPWVRSRGCGAPTIPPFFAAREKSAWDWTMMISSPVDHPRRVEAAMREKAVDGVRFAPYAEGRSVQVLHVGSYDAEGPVLAALHREYPCRSTASRSTAGTTRSTSPTRAHGTGEAAHDPAPARALAPLRDPLLQVRGLGADGGASPWPVCTAVSGGQRQQPVDGSSR